MSWAAIEHHYMVTLPKLMKSNPCKFWKAILPSGSSSHTMKINDVAVYDPEIITSAFNTYFHSVSTTDILDTPAFHSKSHPWIDDVSMSLEVILNLILNLYTKKSCSPNGIPTAFLIKYDLWCSRYLTVIRKSPSSATLLSLWKRATILPLFNQVLLNYQAIIDPSLQQHIHVKC